MIERMGVVEEKCGIPFIIVGGKKRIKKKPRREEEKGIRGSE